MKEFIKQMLSGNSDVSSKRTMGVIGYLTGLVFVGVFDHDLISTVLYVSAGLLGLGVLDKLSQTKK